VKIIQEINEIQELITNFRIFQPKEASLCINVDNFYDYNEEIQEQIENIEDYESLLQLLKYKVSQAEGMNIHFISAPTSEEVVSKLVQLRTNKLRLKNLISSNIRFMQMYDETLENKNLVLLHKYLA